MNSKDNIEKEQRAGSVLRRYAIACFSKQLRIIFCYVVPALLVTALIVAGAWGAKQQERARVLSAANEGLYRQAFSELTDEVYSLHIALSKLLVSKAPNSLALSLDDVWRRSGAISALMGRIPQTHPDSYELNRLLVQTGDYARTLSTAVLRGEELSDKDREQLLSLYTASGEIYESLSDRLAGGNIPTQALQGEDFFAENESSWQKPSDKLSEGNDRPVCGQYSQADGGKYPQLDYDGPYSNSTEELLPKGVGGAELSEAECRQSAQAILSAALGEDNSPNTIEFGPASRSEGKLPCYEFECKLPDGRSADIAVTVLGGKLLHFRFFGPAQTGGEAEERGGESGIERYTENGRSFLDAIGCGEAEPTYVQNYEDSVLITFACVSALPNGGSADGGEVEGSDKVIVYADSVRLRFDLESAAVIGADARGFLYCHTERELKNAVLSREEAEAALSTYFEVTDARLALLPLDDLSERLCWEFRGGFGGDEYLVYIDAQTGEEVRIARIISDENGTNVL